ncbi:MAG: DUF2284 domain-containing protein [Nitrospiraceae bacterium]|nr:DUF2284 domain-containing protein [Nitrospiraceae bacterium]
MGAGNFRADPQQAGFQAIEDIATAYWSSETLFWAVEAGLFGLLDSAGKSPAGKSANELSRALGVRAEALTRILRALCSIGLVCEGGPDKNKDGLYFNSALAGRYLVPGKEDYQGDIVMWRKELRPRWAALKEHIRKNPSENLSDNYLNVGSNVGLNGGPSDNCRDGGRIQKYIRAMDSVARVKAKEILPILGLFPLEGEALDVGAGSGAIAAALLERSGTLRATLMDIPQVIGLTEQMMGERGFTKSESPNGRVDFCAANILEIWPFDDGRFSLVILSNIIHAYSEKELPHILANAARCLNKDGLLLIHDFFPEHHTAKAALFDLNMLINTYNGRVFHFDEVKDALIRLGLSHLSGLVPLESDTALIAASKDRTALSKLRPDPVALLAAKILQLGFSRAVPIRPEDVYIPGWTALKCRYGCGFFGKKPHCPPDAPSHDETLRLIRGCSKALLLEGEPPSRDFQLNVLKAEREAFVSGFYKAFSYWAGPCALCPVCEDTACRNPRDARPSMEAAGMDVFETVRRAGIELKTLGGREDFVKYFALLLLE